LICFSSKKKFINKVKIDKSKVKLLRFKIVLVLAFIFYAQFLVFDLSSAKFSIPIATVTLICRLGFLIFWVVSPKTKSENISCKFSSKLTSFDFYLVILDTRMWFDLEQKDVHGRAQATKQIHRI